MPTVPQSPYEAFTPRIPQAFVLMAIGDLYHQGRLFEDRAKDTREAIASGEFDPAGKNFTKFEASK